ncbi:hypothetical protein PR202_ga26542 [Eleusine coracana subsp. coracana]|uniref:Nucleoporin Nup133/Nup155-like N-terminal domain-containing protein n=1 Tax=Eleusine coracana subsp. coracana TaxID=191504 RepID=A0AAV5DEI4_ELECO|nr:hypothetical protein PR202_ga26542 [Eleusine coracana subsp. coracana]
MAWGEDEAIGPDVASAGLHVSQRIGRDAAAQPDLEEALEASRYASHPYSSHPKESQKSIAALPSRNIYALSKRYECFMMNVMLTLPLIFIMLSPMDGQCQEYNVDEQAICAVGLASAKPGIFVEAIQYLLVLATPVE